MKTILVDAVDCFVSNKGEVNQAMYKMLERYENPKIIVTNAPDDKLSVFGLDKVPYPVFSLQKNPSKTDPTYWQIFLEKNNLSIEDVVYFEHSEEAFSLVFFNKYYAKKLNFQLVKKSFQENKFFVKIFI